MADYNLDQRVFVIRICRMFALVRSDGSPGVDFVAWCAVVIVVPALWRARQQVVAGAAMTSYRNENAVAIPLTVSPC